MLSPVRPIKPEVEKVGGERKQETTSQPLRSPAQTLLLFQLDRKRKPSSGLPNLAFDCTNRVNLKARTPLGRPSKGAAPRGAADLDSRTVDAMVGRCVRKKVEGRGLCKGRVFSYDAAQRIYQIQYDDGKEEALEWLDLKPYLIADSNVIHTESVVERMSLRGQTRLRYKTVNELYTQRKRPGRRVGR